MKWKTIKEHIIYSLLRLSGLFIVCTLAILLFYILSGGIGKISWEFLTNFPTNGMMSGGIFPMILGTLSLMTWCTIYRLRFSGAWVVCCIPWSWA